MPREPARAPGAPEPPGVAEPPSPGPPRSIEDGAGSQTGPYVRFPTHLTLGQLALAQNGVFELDQLAELGLSKAAVHKRAARGQHYRVHRRVYSLVPPELLSLRGRYMAAVLASGPGAVLSHRSAAALHQLRPTARARIEVTVPGRNRRRLHGIEIHRSTTLTPADVTVVDGIPVTTVARTLADLAEVLPERGVERALEQAQSLEILDGGALDDQIRRHPRGACLRRLTSSDVIAAPTESELEELFLELCATAGIPDPERQVYVDPDDGGPMVRADFLWRRQRLIIETDGARFHGTRRSFESDRRRDQRLTVAGWRVIRITWRQITQRPQEVVALLRGLLAGY